MECTSLDVPLDYSRADGTTIKVALIRHRATNGAQRIGSIVVNPGGPGVSGLEAVKENWTRFTPDVMARFDIVGFDPRGIGESSPVHCLDPRPPLTKAYPADADEVAQFVESAKAIAAACQANDGDLLPYVGSENVVRDLDAIRAAIGDERLTFVGVSYGTLIGALYADTFPARVRAMVLDAPIDPALDFYQLNADTAVASQHQLDRFLASCAEDAGCAFHSGGQPRAAFEALMARFAMSPVGNVTSLVAWSAVEWALAVGDTKALAGMLAAASHGDAQQMRSATDWMFEPTLLDSFDAITCADYQTPRTPDGFAKMATSINALAPDFGSFWAYQSFDCAYWPIVSQHVAKPVAAPGAPPIVVIAATGDPLTPYEWGQSLAGQLSSGVLVTRDGDGHTSLEDWCVAQIANSYLLTTTVPRAGSRCP